MFTGRCHCFIFFSLVSWLEVTKDFGMFGRGSCSFGWTRRWLVLLGTVAYEVFVVRTVET